MADSDAEWVGVDFEFGKPDPTPQPPIRPTTARPPPPPRVPATEPPHEAPEVEHPSTKTTESSSSVAVVSGVVGGLLGMALIILILYMLVLRKRLQKAKCSRDDSQYQLRVEDVAHITNLDESSAVYVNTTDLQKLMSTVRAKQKGAEGPPIMPKIQHQTPNPYRRQLPEPKDHSFEKQADNKAFTVDPDVVVVKAPMPIPHNTYLNDTSVVHTSWESTITPPPEAVYCNLQPAEPFVLSNPPTRKKTGTPKIDPPPPPIKKTKTSNTESEAPVSSTVIARPAPPPPTVIKNKLAESNNTFQVQKTMIPQSSKPAPPVAQKPTAPWLENTKVTECVNSSKNANGVRPSPSSLKPIPHTSKPAFLTASKPTPSVIKPHPPTLPKPGVTKKGKDLPPLKMALLPPHCKNSLDDCSTPDTGMLELTPDNTPTPVVESNVTTGSISSKIAFLESKMRTPVLPTRALHPKT